MEQHAERYDGEEFVTSEPNVLMAAAAVVLQWATNPRTVPSGHGGSLMDQALHFITVSTADLEAARSFYVTGLTWRPLLDVPGEIIFFQVAPGLVLGLFDSAKFNADIATGADYSSVSGLTLSHNVDSPEAVRNVVEVMQRAGGTILKSPQEGAFGGIFHAHIQDPNGIVWEIAHNPSWRIQDDGTVTIG